MILSALALALVVAYAHGKAQDNYNARPNPPPMDTPANSYGGQLPPSGDNPKDSYGSWAPKPMPVPKDTPQNSYGGAQVPPMPEIPKDTPQNSYGGVRVPPMPEIPKDTPQNSYGAQAPRPLPLPLDTPRSSYSGDVNKPLDTPKNSYGGWAPKPSDTPTDTGVCKTSDRWMGVVECYDCELDKCAKECLAELPKNFEMCYNKTALFNLKTLFTDCLGTDYAKCHRLTEDMSLAFLLAHYDQRILDINRRDECLFRCGRPRIMNCMNMCDPFNAALDVQKEPIVSCYKSMEGKIHDMLIEFATCLNQYQTLTK